MSETKPDIVGQFETIANVVSPLAIATAMLYYFGWVRTTIQARALGYDASLSGLSTQDYVLKSINVLYLPLIVFMLVAVGLVIAHRAAIAGAQTSVLFTKVMRLVGIVTGLAWTAMVPLAAATTLGQTTTINGFAVPVAIALGMTGVLYADVIRKRLSQQPGLGKPSRILVITLLVLALFWSVERLAEAMGKAYAHDILAKPDQLTTVTVFSPQRLAVTDGCVRETPLAESADAFRYDGLRLLQVTEGKYYLISVCRGTSRILILDPDDDVRLEFVPGARNLRP